MNQTIQTEAAIRYEPRRLSPGCWKIPSSTRPGLLHTTRLFPYSCSCEHGVSPKGYRRTGKPCQHFFTAQEEEEMVAMIEQPAPAVRDADDFDADPFAGHPLETAPDPYANAPLAIACRGCDTRIVIEPGGSLYCGDCQERCAAPVPAMPVVPLIEGSCLWSDRTPFEVWASALDLFFTDSIAA